jgi:UPF0755 protein
MNDILPPKRPLNRSAVPGSSRPTSPSSVPIPPNVSGVSMQPSSQRPVMQPPIRNQPPQKKNNFSKKSKKWLWWLLGGVVGLLLVIFGAAVVWYSAALTPVNPQATEKIQVEVAEGSSPGDIGHILQDEGLIRSGLAFEIYVRLSGTHSQLQAGAYELSSSESTPEIVSRMTSGSASELTVTFLPGATLAENRQVLLSAGFSESEVDAALDKTYNSPLFTDKPADANLEGYIYGETYTFEATVTVEEILERTFTEYWQVIEQNDIIAGFQTQGLNLYEGITLASIVQKEDGNPANQANVAQVFLNRLALDMPLGSDVTYYYGAAKLGVEPSSDLESPYNTRLHTGLPPGPISNPGLGALEAVARPTTHDFLYFISGDDDVLYMAMTNEEHETNVQQHCQVKCQLP